MTRLVVVTNYIPLYDIEFFNRLCELNDELKLTVIADISTKRALNQYDKKMCNFVVVDSPLIEKNGLIFRKNIYRLIKKESPDYLVFYGNPRELTLTFLMILLKLLGKKFYVHGMFHRIGGEKISTKIYFRLIGLLAYKLFTYTRKGAEVLLGLGIDQKKIKIIGTAINEKVSFEFQESIDENDLNDFKLINNLTDKKIVLQVVRLSKIKKPEILIDAAKKILEKRNDIVFILIGGGEIFIELKNEVVLSGMDGNIRMLGPIYDESVLAYWFKSADIFVVPACIGLSAHHAFSYGLPIITDNDLLNQASEFDILYDGLNCKLYESGDIASLTNVISSLLDDDVYRAFLSRNAIETVRSINSLDMKCFNYFKSLNC
jgi:glycosyltransferase involved in cell wall biosynthesis